MGNLKRRLADLWGREAAAPVPPIPSSSTFREGMVVTINRPINISGLLLLPGRYTFRALAANTDGGPIQIFNEAEARLIATLPSVPVS
jgi:hypothetical protein